MPEAGARGSRIARPRPRPADRATAFAVRPRCTGGVGLVVSGVNPASGTSSLHEWLHGDATCNGVPPGPSTVYGIDLGFSDSGAGPPSITGRRADRRGSGAGGADQHQADFHPDADMVPGCCPRPRLRTDRCVRRERRQPRLPGAVRPRGVRDREADKPLKYPHDLHHGSGCGSTSRSAALRRLRRRREHRCRSARPAGWRCWRCRRQARRAVRMGSGADRAQGIRRHPAPGAAAMRSGSSRSRGRARGPSSVVRGNGRCRHDDSLLASQART